MSKVLSLVRAGAPAALVENAAALTQKVTGGSVRTNIVPAAASSAVVIGTDAPTGVYASLTRVPASPYGAYAGVKTAVVRSILPRSAPDTVQLRDALDVYPSAGINSDAEEEQARLAVQRSAQVAVDAAKAAGTGRVTLAVKQASKYTKLNEIFISAATEVLEKAGLTVDVQTTSVVTNQLLMFPEGLGVVLANDVPAAENMEAAFAGAVGGACRTYYTTSGKLSAGHSHKSITLAVAHELRGLGLSAEAQKLEAAAVKSPRNALQAL